jgi:cytochrome b6-f complex iron-sulfur subunit
MDERVPLDDAVPASRRRFMARVSQAFLGLWGVGAFVAIAAYLRSPAGRSEKVGERVVHVGALEDLRLGEGRLVRHGESPFYVVRVGESEVVARSAVCTHLRCILGYDRDRKQFVCPCHSGKFDIAGSVLSGPPPRALPGYSVSIRAGEVYVQV